MSWFATPALQPGQWACRVHVPSDATGAQRVEYEPVTTCRAEISVQEYAQAVWLTPDGP